MLHYSLKPATNEKQRDTNPAKSSFELEAIARMIGFNKKKKKKKDWEQLLTVANTFEHSIRGHCVLFTIRIQYANWNGSGVDCLQLDGFILSHWSSCRIITWLKSHKLLNNTLFRWILQSTGDSWKKQKKKKQYFHWFCYFLNGWLNRIQSNQMFVHSLHEK